MKYRLYDVEQWLEDVDFLQWVKNPSSKQEAIFAPLLNEKSEVSEKMSTAIRLLQNMGQTDLTLSDEEVAKMWKNVADRTFRHNTLPNLYLKRKTIFFSASAVLLLTIVSGLLLYWKNNQPFDYLSWSQQMAPHTSTEAKLIIPELGSVTLSDRMQVAISKTGKIALHSLQGEIVALENKASSGKEMGILSIPSGKRASLVLADGTKIEVCPGSRIIFPLKFGDKKRELFIQGEAFFQVSKNKHWPFLVKTDKMNVEVLGTSFNVNAYPRSSEQSVVLVNGSVSVNIDNRNAIRIRPNQKYTYNLNHRIETVENVDVNPYTSWKDGYFIFNSERLKVVLDKLSGYYGVAMHYRITDMNDIRLSGKLDLNSSLETALKIISTTTPVDYQIKKSAVEIQIKH